MRRSQQVISLLCVVHIGCASDIVIPEPGATDGGPTADAGQRIPPNDSESASKDSVTSPDTTNDTLAEDVKTPADSALPTDTVPGDANAPCDESNPCPSTPCVLGVCVAGLCEFQQLIDGAPCEPTDPCLQSSTCDAGSCPGEPINCDDNDSCTSDACVDGSCTHTIICCEGTGPCDDGDTNTKDDTCNGEGMCVGTIIECPPTTVCTPQYQTDGIGCIPIYANDSTACDDGDLSTKDDICDGEGGCNGSSIECPTPTTCIPSYSADGSGCVPNYAVSGAECDDGSNSTEADACNGEGLCTGVPYSCPASDACTSGYTQDGSGCIPIYVPMGTTCGTASDICKLAEVCDGAGTCQAEVNAADGTACGDPTSTACNGADTCLSGECVANYSPANTVCGPPPTDCQNTPVCDGAGSCEPPTNKPNNSGCGSAATSACDGADFCQDGICQPNYTGAGTVCTTASSDCTIPGTCDGAGVCGAESNKPNGTACGSAANNACTAPDTCVDGVCEANDVLAGTACSSPANDCVNAAECDGSGGCGDETSKINGAPCGDSADTLCSNPDTCVSGKCIANHESAGTVCGTASNDCRNPEVCDSNGTCLPETSKINGSSCGSALKSDCTDADSCFQGVCQANNVTDGTECGEVTSDCTVGTCQSGLCSGTTQASAGSSCEYTSIQDDQFVVCGTCTSTGSCSAGNGLNTFCHNGSFGAICNSSMLYACAPCANGYNSCFLDFDIP